jgi:hypothetical protein
MADSLSSNKTSLILNQQLPDFVKEDHANFVQFMKSYYEFLEETDPPTEIPLILENPNPQVYSTEAKAYANASFTVGENITQKANPDNSSEITASAKVFSFSSNNTAKTIVATSFEGTQRKFVSGYEIYGEQSGARFWPQISVESLKAGASRASSDLRDTKNIDETLDDYIDYIKTEFAINLPRNLHADTDTRTALKNIRDFYKSRGTENSFKFLFQLLYGEDVSIYLPQTDMLRASDANWRHVTILRTGVPAQDFLRPDVPVTTSNLLGRKIKGTMSGATAIVETAELLVSASGFQFVQMEVSHKKGTFSAGESVQTDNVGDGTVIQVILYGMVNNLNITNPGSNYKVGDRLSISDGFDGGEYASAEVATVNASSGAITGLNILDPGYKYSSVPTIDITGPHNGDVGASRYEEGPLETIYYNDFSQYTDANSFFTESDNRGALTNSVAFNTSQYAYSGTIGVKNPASVHANSILNFGSIPGVDDGLKGWWRMNQYHSEDVKINSLDGTFGDGADPTANNIFKGPRIGDILFVSDRAHANMATTQKNYVNYSYTSDGFGGDRTGANTYSSIGWVGFQPVVFDASGHDHHAYPTVHRDGADAPSINVYSEYAFANAGIYGAGSNSLGTFGEGGMVLMPHDDIRNANTQSWVFWYKPHIHDKGTVNLNGTRIITRDRSAHWSIVSNNFYTDIGAAGDYTDMQITFTGAQFDNGTPVQDDKLANSAGYFPGGPLGAFEGLAEGAAGALRLGIWNMIAITLDYNTDRPGNIGKTMPAGGGLQAGGVGNVYVFNTVDGLHVANGFTFHTSVDANVSFNYTGAQGWEHAVAAAPTIQGRAVVLGENCESANGDNFASENILKAQGQYDEVRYFDKALSEQQVFSLFKNPSGAYDKTLSGDWMPVQIPTAWNAADVIVPNFVQDDSVAGGVYFNQGHEGDREDGLTFYSDQNISYDPTVRYKMSVRAKDGLETSASNTRFGVIGLANTGTHMLNIQATSNPRSQYALVMDYNEDGVANPENKGSLGPDWFVYTGTFGGNTTHIGYKQAVTIDSATGGNTKQNGIGSFGGRPKREFTWANPANLHGTTTGSWTGSAENIDRYAFTGNTAFFRPAFEVNSHVQDDSTQIDYIKIERCVDAIITAEVGAEFALSEETGDSGKIGTSTTSAWISKYIQDDKYYQIYSYVLKSGLSIGTYKEVVRKLTHPAGLVMFGQVSLDLLASVRMKAFNQTFLPDVIDLLREFYMGAESTQLEDYADVPLAGTGVGYHTRFGLNNTTRHEFNLDASHGTTPHGAGRNITGSPGWIAWDQSPLTSPYANSHYYAGDDVVDLLTIQGFKAHTSVASGPGTYSLTNGETMERYVVIPLVDRSNFPLGSKISIPLNDDRVITRTVDSHGSTGFGGAWGVLYVDEDIPYTYVGGAAVSISQDTEITGVTSALWPYLGNPTNGAAAFETSNAYTTVTDNSLIWHIKGFRTILGTAYKNANVGALFAHSQAYGYDNSDRDVEVGSYSKGWALATGNWGDADVSADAADKLKGDVIGSGLAAVDWYHKGFGITSPLDLDGNVNRYVRMKVRRIGPGGYGADSWLGVCQPETKPTGAASLFGPTMGLTPTEWNNPFVSLENADYVTGDRSKFYGSANTAQPSTLIIPVDASPNTKSPWHILEWDMHELGTMTASDDAFFEGTFPDHGGATLWKNSDASTGISPQDGGPGRRIGHIGFHLCYEPDNGDEKFEIEWIQADDGTGWPRGSYSLPLGYVANNTHDNWTSDGSGTGGAGSYNRRRAVESTDMTNQTIGDFSVSVFPSPTQPSEITRGTPVLYVHSDKSIFAHAATGLNANDAVFDANGAIFRASANTANNLDWVVTEIIDSEKFLRTAPGSPALGDYVGGGTLTGNGQFSGPVILDTDVYDNLYVGYLYEDPSGGYPGFDGQGDSKPLMLFRLTPTDNVQSDLALPADPHNLRSSGSDVGSFHGARGRSNTYSAEQILWGNTGGTDGVGVMVGGYPLYSLGVEQWGDSETGGSSGSFVDFSTDDMGSLYIVGSGSQNIIKILPGVNGTYANGVTRVLSDLVGKLPGRSVYEIANTTTLDANNDVLGNWRPTNIIPGPKDSLFVACDTGYDPTNRGANSVYCYHVVTEQNISTGEFYTKNVYPVFANTQSRNDFAAISRSNENLAGMRQSCAGLVLDHESPPNLYYMSANNMYRIKPKGYSYQIGDAEIEQVFPEDYFHNTLNMPVTANQCLGFSRHSDGSSFGGAGSYGHIQYQNNYQRIQVDSRNRIYFGGMSNLFCYSRGSNTDLLLYNQSNTEFSTLQVVVNTAMYTSNVIFGYGVDNAAGEVNASIDSFVIGARTSNSAFTGGEPGNPSTGANNFSEGVYITMHNGEHAVGGGSFLDQYTNVNGRRLIAIYPNTNGSFVPEEGGQLAMTIMDENPDAETKFAIDGTGGANKFRGIGPGKIALRPEKI